jgi:peptidoglycan/LPS O-acetylase OafA/YrhL
MARPSTLTPGKRTRYRFIAVGIAVVATIAVWLVATFAGLTLDVSTPLAHMTVDLPTTTVGALLGGLAGWGALALLEKFTSRPRKVWTIIAVVVLVVSLPPLATLDAAEGTKLTLALMHIATGLPLILLLPRGAGARSNLSPAPAARP